MKDGQPEDIAEKLNAAGLLLDEYPLPVIVPRDVITVYEATPLAHPAELHTDNGVTKQAKLVEENNVGGS